MIAHVRRAGVSTIQDGGRFGFEDVGVPSSGAWHRERYLLAVGLLVGAADESTPAIELLGGTLDLLLGVDTTVAVVGPARVTVDGQPAVAGTCLHARSGQPVRVEHHGRGPVYVALGGWVPARVLGSASTDTFAGLGPAPLAAGDALGGQGADVTALERVGAFHRPLPEASGPIRVVLTGHPSGGDIVGTPWTVAATARSGVRLRGPAVPGEGDVPSEPMVRGAIQVTPSGDPVVLGPDGGLTGGYPVAAVVATVDQDRLSLLVPGDTVAFRACELREATDAYRARARSLSASIAHPGLLH